MANTEDLKSSEAKPLVGSSPTSGKTFDRLKELKYSLHFSLYCDGCKRNRSFIAHKIHGGLTLHCFNCRKGYEIHPISGQVKKFKNYELKSNEENSL